MLTNSNLATALHDAVAPSTSTTPRQPHRHALFHIGGSGGPVRDVAGRQVRDPARRRPERVLRLIETERITATSSSPRADVPSRHAGRRDRDYSSLRTCSTAPPPSPRTSSSTACGSSSAASPTLRHDRDDRDDRGAACRGPRPGRPRHHLLRSPAPAPGVELRIVVPTRTTRRQEWATSGRSGPLALQHGGYWEPRRDATTIRDGWLHTGDAGYIDADGYLFLHDRIKDMWSPAARTSIPRGGELILSDPRVADAAVIGVPDEKWVSGQGHRGARQLASQRRHRAGDRARAHRLCKKRLRGSSAEDGRVRRVAARNPTARC